MKPDKTESPDKKERTLFRYASSTPAAPASKYPLRFELSGFIWVWIEQCRGILSLTGANEKSRVPPKGKWKAPKGLVVQWVYRTQRAHHTESSMKSAGWVMRLVGDLILLHPVFASKIHPEAVDVLGTPKEIGAGWIRPDIVSYQV